MTITWRVSLSIYYILIDLYASNIYSPNFHSLSRPNAADFLTHVEDSMSSLVRETAQARKA